MIININKGPNKLMMGILSRMSILGQMIISHNLKRVVTVIHVPRYVRSITVDRVYQQFEKPHDALGNRHHNPLSRLYHTILNLFLVVPRTLRILPETVSRIEIAVRIRPKS